MLAATIEVQRAIPIVMAPDYQKDYFDSFVNFVLFDCTLVC